MPLLHGQATGLQLLSLIVFAVAALLIAIGAYGFYATHRRERERRRALLAKTNARISTCPHPLKQLDFVRGICHACGALFDPPNVRVRVEDKTTINDTIIAVGQKFEHVCAGVSDIEKQNLKNAIFALVASHRTNDGTQEAHDDTTANESELHKLVDAL